MNPDFIRLEIVQLLVGSEYYNDANVPDTLRVTELITDSKTISDFILSGQLPITEETEDDVPAS